MSTDQSERRTIGARIAVLSFDRVSPVDLDGEREAQKEEGLSGVRAGDCAMREPEVFFLPHGTRIII